MRNQLLSSVAAVALVAVTGGTSLAAEPADWNGFYVGVHLGGGVADFDQRPHEGETGDGIAKLSPSGIVGGAHVGYNWQVDTFVLGLEADVSGTDWSKEELHPGNSDREAEADVDLLASLRARIGMNFDHSLLYVTGGLAYAQASWVAISPGGTVNAGDHDIFGGVAGLGFEWKQTQNLSWRLEGLYYMFHNTEEGSSSSHDFGPRSEFKDAVVGRLGVSYQFSDIRLKRDIALLSRLDNGLGLYRYRYLWSDQVHVGVMAQEVDKVMPAAVARGADGYLRVDYQQLGLRLMTRHEGTESSKAVLAVAA